MWTGDGCRRPFVCGEGADCSFVFDGFLRISITHYRSHMCRKRALSEALSESRQVLCSVYMKPLTSVTFIFPPTLHSSGRVSNPFKAVCAFGWGKKKGKKEETFSVFNALLRARTFRRSPCSPERLGVVDSTK